MSPATSRPRGGRRVATRRPPTGRGRLGVAAGLLAAAAAALVTAQSLSATPVPSPAATTVPVGEVTAVCAGWPGTSARTVRTVAPSGATSGAGAAASSATAGPGDGRLRTGVVGGRHRVTAPPSPGEVVEVPTARRTAVEVSATGAAAAGRVTWQADTTGGAAATTAVQDCPAPRGEWWFTGAGADLDHRSTLLLANPDPGPAVLDVEVLGPSGPVSTVGTRGITLGPGEVRALDLVDLAPQAEEAAVHVETSRGRVAAAVADSVAGRPGGPSGREWLPSQAAPARVLRLSPVPPGPDTAELVVANPGDREALVTVRLSGSSGSFEPVDLGEVRVPPGSVVTADLAPALRDESSSVVLRAEAALVATVRVRDGGDHSYAGAAPVLGADGGVAGVLGRAGAALQLAADGRGGPVAVAAVGADGDVLAERRLELGPAATVSWDLPLRARYVTVTPAAGVRVFGAVALGEVGQAQSPVTAPRSTVRRPAVRQSIS